MDVIEQNVALQELWSRRDEYGLEFVLDEMNRLLEMGLISADDFQRLMVVDGKNPSAHLHHPQRHHKGLNQRPLHTQLPPAQVLSILSQNADAVKREEWTNNVQETVRDLISTILDQEKYSSLPDIQGQVEATTGIDMRSHLDWLQDTIFQQSKQKLKRINQAAEVIRVTAASTRVQRAFRARRWALRRRSRLRLEHTRVAADRVAQQAIQGYALDVVRRLVLRHVLLRRFRLLVQRLQREVVQQHALDIARRHMARYRVASWLRVSWPRYTLAKETHRRLTELEASVATMAQALVRGFLVRRRHICINNSVIHIQHVFRRYRLDKVQSAAATTLQTWTRKQRAVATYKEHRRQQIDAMQCILRMYRRWRHVRNQRAAVAVVEAWRGRHLAIRRAKDVASDRRWQRLLDASCRSIQRRFRSFLGRVVLQRQVAANCIQRNMRRHRVCLLRRQVAGMRIFRQVWAWRFRRERVVQRVLHAGNQQCIARRQSLLARKTHASKIIATIVQGWVLRCREAKNVAATRLGRWVRKFLARQRALLERKQRSSGRVPIRPPAKKPYTVPAATANPPETIQTLPPVRLVKRFERMCKTCHRHAHPHACEEMAVASSPVKKMVAVRTFGGRVTKATAMRAHELLLLGDMQRHHRHLQSQPPFVAKPPATNDSTKPLSLRKSLSLMRGIPTSNQEHHGV
ncbi:hypothetical protein H257_04708 [Aphanomyces astaci]|uniref:Uncharacterized protein n=1 Tax=Aphanomyces astaci TaxID=112090 RepID=W4GUE9_APHAT|nr:hypothetical protein H257_04708 [Aphanomyces astaci]ETV82946.1 hypothetical protein H257_04708 [Aphanomyces astaci]|eukprot:XP_009827617.1 hypothetical protein H257_04708 [Aphanomyces astaci]